ncbi:MAG: MlaD family protein [Chlamydiota bacterium]|jgi:phospholipid/cholesterol/gamma-HCH transport system substrate-binding protein
MSDKLKTVLIGVFVITAIVITISIILFLEPKVGDGEKVLKVRFSNIAGINVGTRVTFAGKPVGEVTKIQEVSNAREQPTDELGRVYFYQLTLRVDSSVDVYNTDEVTIATAGLMGEKAIAIIPKAPPVGKVPKLITNQIIYADSVDPLENAIYELTTLAKSLDGVVNNIDEWFMENSDDITFAIQSFAGSMHELDLALNSLNEQEIVIRTKKAIDSFTENMELLGSSIQEFQDDQTITKFNNVLENVNIALDSFNIDGKQVLKNLNIITNDIADGSGTIGKLVTKDDMYLRIVSLMSKMNTLMNDVNHYGILFQYDKKWQRTRKKRVALLEAVDTPKEFKQYFESEVDQISTALSRLNMLLEKAEDQDEKSKIMKSEPFIKDFKELLYQVDDLSDALKAYNEELVDQVNECIN